MRLSKIKLAGFKSFVDPTTIPFPSNLVGVVGPNGCGKSNVIDAVRWVMGESSASRLRGDSITDVIFNGSSSRKPVGTASVELLFDNSDSTLEGQYAKYSEISIRREVSRDGISNYFLNGTRCRRKDITGVFLGTGLGPRSYSIIEQGMISRVIEAKPEEMRVFLEEAAGISKYKERRRETENRIRHTKENLERLMDLLEEVEKQIKHLDRQAKTAERYRKLKKRERLLAAELLALKLRDLDERAKGDVARLEQRQTALQAAIAEQRKFEAAIEEARVSQTERSDAFNVVQSRYYKVGSEIARLEQAIEHGRELRERQRQDLEQAKLGVTEIAGHIDKDQGEIEQLELSLSELVPDLERARDAEKRSAASLEQSEKALADWQARWDELGHLFNDAAQTGNVERTRIEQIELKLNGFVERRRKLAESDGGSSLDELHQKFASCAEREQRQRQARDEFERHLASAADEIAKLREQDQKLSHLVDERKGSLQKMESRYASLEALQKAALGEGDDDIHSWLKSAGLDGLPRVAQSMDVQSGWERAVETVLGDYLQAVCVSDVASVAESLGRLAKGSITLVNSASESQGGALRSGTLAEKVSNAPAGVLTRLEMVQVADSLQAALAMRERLGGGQSVITTDGVWLSREWLRVSRDKDVREGVLSREQEMRRLKSDIQEQMARTESAQKLLKDGRSRLTQLEEKREVLQKDAAALLKEYSEAKAELDTARFRLEQGTARKTAIAEESKEIESEILAAENALRESRMRLQQADNSRAEMEGQREGLSAYRDELRKELTRVREQAGEDRRSAQSIAIQYESRRTSRESAAQSLQRMENQLAQFRRREKELVEQLTQGDEPLKAKEHELAGQLESRIAVEKELAESRAQVEAVESRLRELDQQRMIAEQQVDEIRSTVDEARLVVQEVRVRREGIAEQLAQTDYTFESLVEEIDEEASVSVWDEELEKVRGRIDRLGPINLAAIDEFKEQSERKEYLDSQLADLNSALATLEGAIRKIDRETRARFKETFDKVDAGFKKLFPKLFGGGHAYMELTGDDLLSAGVTVMARPPGKRNSTIHLLSGGEKALTAVALVFAIFELNPAPFCLLDEVDAPLDDQNVGRFCDIVKEMSDRVQFVFITHNKVTMEMSRQLTGVTMHEPGVSRLVSVDLDEAVKMAAS
jgi:chromosome segregation protein